LVSRSPANHYTVQIDELHLPTVTVLAVAPNGCAESVAMIGKNTGRDRANSCSASARLSAVKDGSVSREGGSQRGNCATAAVTVLLASARVSDLLAHAKHLFFAASRRAKRRCVRGGGLEDGVPRPEGHPPSGPPAAVSGLDRGLVLKLC